MPYSYPYLEDAVIDWLRRTLPRDATLLDVGPGAGKWGYRLRPHFPNIDAVEIWAPYLERFGLAQWYRRVEVADALTFDLSPYRSLILGDVLEHWRPAEAREFLRRARQTADAIVVCVPFRYEQGAWEGNPHEIHHQPELTPALMGERYPELRLVTPYPESDPITAFYAWERPVAPRPARAPQNP